MCMIKQMHSRLFEALMGDGYGFVTKEVESTDMSTAMEVDSIMRWAIKSYANNHKGIELTIDDWVWDTCKEGWGILKRRWVTEQKKIVLTREEIEQINNERTVENVLNSLTQIVTSFDGPVIETVDHERILFPGECQDPGDLDEHKLVSVLVSLSKQDLEDRVRSRGWDKASVEKILKFEQASTGNEEVDDATRLKNAAQGTRA